VIVDTRLGLLGRLAEYLVERGLGAGAFVDALDDDGAVEAVAAIG
jgi:hypothetical protein